MRANVGPTDQVIRIVLGVALLSLLFIMEGGIRYIGLLGIVFIITGLIRFCPLYLPFKINTRKK